MKKLFVFVYFVLLLGISANSHANENEQDKFIQKFTNAKKSKIMILNSFNDLSQCGVGSCHNTYTTHICEQIAAVDIQTGYQITGSISGADRKFKLNPADLALFKSLYASCKPTTYQYWNFDSLFHVAYAGDTQKAIAKLKKSLK